MMIQQRFLFWWLIPLLLLLLSCTVMARRRHTSATSFVANHRRSDRKLQRGRIHLSSSPSSSVIVDQLLELVDNTGGGTSYSKKTPEERQKILELMKALEDTGKESRYLDDEVYVGHGDDAEMKGGMFQWDSYELKYFDRSIDGDRGSAKHEETKAKSEAARRPFGIRSKILGNLFGLRYSFQHLERPGRAVNDVGFKVLGIPACVVAGGDFSRVDKTALDQIRDEFGTELRSDTAVRIDFEAPKLWLGNAKRFPLVLSLGAKAQSPPVTLCTTYLDDRIRLALAAKGGRLLFTKGGKTEEAYAQDWRLIENKKPVRGRVVVASLAVGIGAACKWIPSVRIPVTVAVTLPTILALLQTAKRRFGAGGEKVPNI